MIEVNMALNRMQISSRVNTVLTWGLVILSSGASGLGLIVGGELSDIPGFSRHPYISIIVTWTDHACMAFLHESYGQIPLTIESPYYYCLLPWRSVKWQ